MWSLGSFWLSQTYSHGGYEIFGGSNGVLDGFKSLMPEGGELLVSDESADYRPEMTWLTEQLGDKFSISKAEDSSGVEGQDTYRFFEWFDWENIPASQKLAASPKLTPPCKPHLEEKLWLALLWSPAMKRGRVIQSERTPSSSQN